MSDVFREIDQDLRLERYRALARRYGPYAIALVVLVVAAIGGQSLWTTLETDRRNEEADRYAQSVEHFREGRRGEAIAELAEIARDGGGYAVLARLTEAAALASGGDLTGAVAVYDLLIEDRDVESHYQGLARILSATLLLDQGAEDDIKRRLEPLGDGAWQYLARELEAHLAYRQSDLEEAREGFAALAGDVEAPRGVRARAQEMLLLWGNSNS